MKKYIGLLLILFVLTVNTMASEYSHVPRIKDKYGNSLNWAGYAVTGSHGSVTDVKGSWIVPAVTCSLSTTNQYSAFWVGIDGYNSGTVEQIGTSSDCNGNNANYYAWYEFYPKYPAKIPITVEPGDNISAEVRYTGKGLFVVSITDTTTGRTFSTSGKVPQAQRSSAEWIAEAPWSGGVLPLANFGIVNFGLDNTRINSTNYATIGGNTGAMGSFGTNTSITMVDTTGTVKAQPSPISDDKTSFNVTWENAGP